MIDSHAPCVYVCVRAHQITSVIYGFNSELQALFTLQDTDGRCVAVPRGVPFSVFMFAAVCTVDRGVVPLGILHRALSQIVAHSPFLLTSAQVRI